MRAKLRDTEIYFDVEGMGLVPDDTTMHEKPVMFALHGGPGGDHTNYKPALTPLADKVQIVYVDHRGQGRSARGPKETYTLDNNVEDLEALRQHLGLRQVIVYGASYGGMVALAYAARYPQNVSYLIAAVTAPDSRFLATAKRALAERGTPEQIAFGDILWAGAFRNDEQLKDYFEQMGPLYSLKFDPELAAKRRGRGTVSYEAINVAFGGFMRDYDLRPELPRITAPALVIGARHDWICAPEYSEEIAKLIPNADLRIFEHSGHSVLVDEHQAFIDVVRGFITYKR